MKMEHSLSEQHREPLPTITEGVTAELMTESKYGDYQLDLDGLTDTIPSGTAIYGVIVSTKKAAITVCVIWKYLESFRTGMGYRIYHSST